MPDNGGKRLKEEYETIDLLEILRLLKKNLLVILAVAILLAVAGYLVSAFAMTPQYEASATLIVNSREDQATTQVPITNDQLTSATKLVDTYAVILTSDTVLDKTISNLNLNMSYNDLVERVRIESVNSTQVMKITVKDTGCCIRVYRYHIISNNIICPARIRRNIDSGYTVE